jgi:hypothetical protein
VLPKYSN